MYQLRRRCIRVRSTGVPGTKYSMDSVDFRHFSSHRRGVDLLVINRTASDRSKQTSLIRAESRKAAHQLAPVTGHTTMTSSHPALPTHLPPRPSHVEFNMLFPAPYQLGKACVTCVGFSTQHMKPEGWALCQSQ